MRHPHASQDIRREKATRLTTARLCCESLEDRTLLTAVVGDVPAAAVKILVSDQALVQQLVDQGAQLVVDYGSYDLLQVPAEQAETLAGQAGVEVHAEFDYVMLNAGFVDTSAPSTWRSSPPPREFAGNIFQLVQFAGPVVPAWYESLTGTGVQVVTYIPSNAYLVYGDSASMQQLDAWAQEANYVQWVGAFLDEYKIDAQLTPSEEAQWEVGEVPVLVAIQMFLDEAANADTMAAINPWQIGEIVADIQAVGYRDVFVQLPFHAIRDVVAVRPDVVAIQPFALPEKLDEAQNLIIVNQMTAGVPTAGADYLTYLASQGFTQAQFDASGFSVAVVDDGVDNGTVTPNHFALYRQGDLTAGDRLVFNRQEAAATASGIGGHGNLNAHIVGGYVPSGTVAGTNFDVFPHSDANSFKYGLGVAPYVYLGSANVFGAGTVFQDLESRNYAAGARISTNSWGFLFTNGQYTVNSQIYDGLVRDAQPATAAIPVAGNQEMVIVFAAGNSGPGATTVLAPGTGKNVITVGASENVRAFGGADGSGIADVGANNANDIISFSSRGPTTDLRFKPELVAPGTHVTGGVWQANAVMTPNGVAAAGYTGGSVSGGVASIYFPSAGQQYYTASSGTSHAAPAVAGGAALIRQRYINGGLAPPSPALTKAALMASTRYMNGVGANDTLWSNSQGMGEMNLDTFFNFFVTPTISLDQSAANTFTAAGQTRTFTGTIANSSMPMRITLAWTDQPGPLVGNSYVNNLDLQVTVGGNTYLGNVFLGANSVTGGAADFRNNAESVFLPAGVSGPITITIRATGINGDGVPNFGGALDQDFALIAYNVIADGTGNPPGSVGEGTYGGSRGPGGSEGSFGFGAGGISPYTAPSVSGEITTDRPTFIWPPETDATGYALVIVDHQTGRPVVNVSGLAGPSYTLGADQALTPGHAYTWYHGAFVNQITTYSEGVDFEISPLPAPTQVGPEGTLAPAVGFDTPTFQWNAVSGADHYYLYVVDNDTGVAVVNNPNVNDVSFTPSTPFTPGHQFTWYVGAVSTNGLAISYLPTGRTFRLAPLASPDLTGPAGTIGVSPNFDQPTFTWTSVIAADHYYLYVLDNNTGQAVINNPSVRSTLFIASQPLTPGHSFTYYVGAISKNGLAISYLPSGRTFSLAPLAAPALTGPIGTSGNSTGFVTFTWGSVASADRYFLYLVDNSTGQALINDPYVYATFFRPAQALTPGHRYTYYVGAISANGLANSYRAAGQTFDVVALAAPTLLGPKATIAASADFDQPTFTWTSVSDADHYYLYVVDNTTGHAVINEPSVYATTYTAAQPLTPGHHFTYYVGAISVNGLANSYLPQGQAFHLAALAAPTLLGPSGAIADTAGFVTFTWTGVIGADRYYLYVVDTNTGQAVINDPYVNATSFTLGHGLTIGHRYTWYVAAISRNGLAYSYLFEGQTFNWGTDELLDDDVVRNI